LKEGLVANGHEVFLASDGNGYKNYPRDFDWFTNPKLGRFRHVFEIGKIFTHKELFMGYDVVLLIGPTIFSRFISVIRPIFEFLIRNNGKVFLSGAGLNAAGITYWYDTNEKYHGYVDGNMKDNPGLIKSYNNKSTINWEYELMDKINGYIPIWYEYAQPYRNHPKLLKTLRIPIKIENEEYRPNKVSGKVVFMHGISTRPTAKGTQYINDAFIKMSTKYGDIAEFFTAGGLPFNEYMDLVSKTNVILDDANSYSIAMNGLYSLVKGKIVMGGAEPIANYELGLKYNPVINLCPDVDQICSCIEDVINHRDEIEEMGLKGRKFVEEYHDCRDIAKQYVELFEKY
jgi:hypothetical protein